MAIWPTVEPAVVTVSGGTRVDLHVKVLDDTVVRRAKARGLDAIVYAPHFVRLPEIRRRAATYADDDLAIIPGREVFTGTWRSRKHVLALDLDDPVPDFITLEGAMAEFDRQGAVVLVPHPDYLTVSLTSTDVTAHADRIDALEVYNPKYLPWHNRRARDLQVATDRPAFGSSYAHLPGTVGEAWTRFPDADPTPESILAALRSGATRIVERRPGASHRVRCALELGHLLYENSWQKANRVLLSDQEATHPDQPAYEGRFDDVRA